MEHESEAKPKKPARASRKGPAERAQDELLVLLTQLVRAHIGYMEGDVEILRSKVLASLSVVTGRSSDSGWYDVPPPPETGGG